MTRAVVSCALLTALLAAGLSSSAAAQPGAPAVIAGPERPVALAQAGTQLCPRLTASATAYAVVWGTSAAAGRAAEDGLWDRLWLRRLGEDGSPAGPPILVAELQTPRRCGELDVAAKADGGFVVSWIDRPSGEPGRVLARWYRADGSLLREVIVFDFSDTESLPFDPAFLPAHHPVRVVAEPGGDVWMLWGYDAPGILNSSASRGFRIATVFGFLFDANGLPVIDPQRLFSTPRPTEVALGLRPRLVPLRAGHYVAAGGTDEERGVSWHLSYQGHGYQVPGAGHDVFSPLRRFDLLPVADGYALTWQPLADTEGVEQPLFFQPFFGENDPPGMPVVAPLGLDSWERLGEVAVIEEAPGRLVFLWSERAPLEPLSAERLSVRLSTHAGLPAGEALVLDEGFLAGASVDGASSLSLASTRPGVALAAWQDDSTVAVRSLAVQPPRLDLQDSRFAATVTWDDGQGGTGSGVALPLTRDTGYFWFFRDGNVELVIKVLDGRPVNGHFWVFGGALTNVAYELQVVDRQTGDTWRRSNPAGNLASFADTTAFSDGRLGKARRESAARAPVREAPAAPATLPLGDDDRFELTVDWFDPRSGDSGTGHAVRLTDDTGAFWFFKESNVELVVKVLDGRPVNGHFWVFAAGLSDVGYTLTVTDTTSGGEQSYDKDPFVLQSFADTIAFTRDGLPPGEPSP